MAGARIRALEGSGCGLEVAVRISGLVLLTAGLLVLSLSTPAHARVLSADPHAAAHAGPAWCPGGMHDFAPQDAPAKTREHHVGRSTEVPACSPIHPSTAAPASPLPYPARRGIPLRSRQRSGTATRAPPPTALV